MSDGTFCQACNYTSHSLANMLTHVHSKTHEEKIRERSRAIMLPKILDYLQSQKVSMWGRTYYLHDDDGLQRAADWLLSVIEEVQNARSNVELHPGSPRADVPEVPEPVNGRSVNPRSGDLHLGTFLRSSHD